MQRPGFSSPWFTTALGGLPPHCHCHCVAMYLGSMVTYQYRVRWYGHHCPTLPSKTQLQCPQGGRSVREPNCPVAHVSARLHGMRHDPESSMIWHILPELCAVVSLLLQPHNAWPHRVLACHTYCKGLHAAYHTNLHKANGPKMAPQRGGKGLRLPTQCFLTSIKNKPNMTNTIYPITFLYVWTVE